MSDYSTNDPKGWCGDPSRGAALGRPTIKGEPEGKITIRRSPLDRQGYDRNGTYFGVGGSLFWIADEGGEVDFMERSPRPEWVIERVKRAYPGVEIEMGEPLSLPCWGHGEHPCPDKADAEPGLDDQCEECFALDCEDMYEKGDDDD